ncbi:MAG TPA: hypothetical protein VFK02_21600 [Kofleriaceae bacterium]|nr:hypothetical protein [Kofleriaceae bacterium]
MKRLAVFRLAQLGGEAQQLGRFPAAGMPGHQLAEVEVPHRPASPRLDPRDPISPLYGGEILVQQRLLGRRQGPRRISRRKDLAWRLRG